MTKRFKILAMVVIAIGVFLTICAALYSDRSMLGGDDVIRDMEEAQAVILRGKSGDAPCTVSKETPVAVQRYLYVNRVKQGKPHCVVQHP